MEGRREERSKDIFEIYRQTNHASKLRVCAILKLHCVLFQNFENTYPHVQEHCAILSMQACKNVHVFTW